MANRYWVGGTASWDGTAGTKWALTSGGAGGQAVPTAADDVFFDGASGANTVTIATGNTGAKSITCTGFTGTLTGTAAITVSGNVTLVAGMTYTHTGTMTFNATGTLITAGKSFSGVTVNGSGITLTLGDALDISTRTITLTQGTFNTGGFNVTASALSSLGSSTREFQLSSSTITLSSTGRAIDFRSASNFTFTAGTSQINVTTANASVETSTNITFYNLAFTSTAEGTRSIAGAGTKTYNNLSLTASAAGMSQLTLSSDLTVNGTLTCAGSSAIARGFVRSDTFGTTRTITAAAISANDCDFQDITLAGAAAGASPTRAGNCGGNSGITFPAAKTVYRVGTNTTWAGSSSWATGSGGTGADTNFPLPQDTAVIDNSTTLTGTLSLAVYNISALNCSTRTTGITLDHSSIVSRFGAYTLGSGVTVSGTSLQTFASRNTMDFTSAGKTITFPISVNSIGGTFRLLDALTMTSTVALTHTNGTINLNGFNLTVGTNYATSTGTKNLTFNGGTLVCPAASASAFNNIAPTNFTTTAGTGTGTINMTAATAKTFVGGGSTYNCTLNNGGAGALTITGNNTFTTLANSVQPTTFRFTAGTTTTLTNWNISGTAGNLVTIQSVTAAAHTLSKASGTVGADYLSITNSTATGGALWSAGANSVNGGGNTGWVFGALVTAAMAATETGPDTFSGNAFIGPRVTAAMAATETGPDTFSGNAFIGPRVTAAMAATETGPDTFAGSAFIGPNVTAAMAATETGPDTFSGSAFIGPNVTAAMAATETGPDTFSGAATISGGITASMAASEVGPDILAANAFIGYNVTAAMAASEVGPDVFAGSAFIGTIPPPSAGGVFFIELRSFTERRRF